MVEWPFHRPLQKLCLTFPPANQEHSLVLSETTKPITIKILVECSLDVSLEKLCKAHLSLNQNGRQVNYHVIHNFLKDRLQMTCHCHLNDTGSLGSLIFRTFHYLFDKNLLILATYV